MDPKDLAEWFGAFYTALMETQVFTEDQAMAIILRTSPKSLEGVKADSRELIRKEIEKRK